MYNYVNERVFKSKKRLVLKLIYKTLYIEYFLFISHINTIY